MEFLAKKDKMLEPDFWRWHGRYSKKAIRQKPSKVIPADALKEGTIGESDDGGSDDITVQQDSGSAVE